MLPLVSGLSPVPAEAGQERGVICYRFKTKKEVLTDLFFLHIVLNVRFICLFQIC